MTFTEKSAHPAPDKRRENWFNLNGEWDFSLDLPRYDKKINVPFSIASPLSGIAKDYKGAGCYRRVVRYTPRLPRLFLVIGACDYECRVTVNGQKLGTHLGGYARFEFELTGVWNRNGDNVIEIRSFDDDSTAHTYGKQGYGNIRGIWQTVYLEERPSSFIRDFVIRTAIDGTVTVRAEIDGEYDSFSAAFSDTETADFVREPDNTAALSFKIDTPRLWSPDSPVLYHGTLKLSRGSETDEVFTYFGIREIGSIKCSNGRRYVSLNGKPVYLNSTLDQSFNPQGFFTLPTDADCEKEILRLKKLGLNSVRIHIKSEEPLKLYYADKHGLLVIQDIPCFWGEPTEEARKLFDVQMIECMKRDINHPSIIQWVLYNETWGLFTGTGDDKVYTKDTQEWVRYNYKRAKTLDPTRLVEDNSPCNKDHVVTDINTYHFYRNGYQNVKDVIEEYAAGAPAGSTKNFTPGNVAGDVPHMNSECGNVWGVDGSAGDSDMSWHYKYMLNEFRLHDAVSGFVFTEFHDVVNEFNGYYRIDNAEKVFGYGDYVPGMTIRDLHAQDFLAYDFPPMKSCAPGETVKLPLFISSFTDERHHSPMKAAVELAATDADGHTEIVERLTLPFTVGSYGLTPVGEAVFKLPYYDCVAVARLYLKDENDATVMRNFVCFDVNANRNSFVLPLESAVLNGEGGLCQEGEKLNALSGSSVTFTLDPRSVPEDARTLRFEASARETFTRDRAVENNSARDLSYMLGYRVDRGANPNCFFQTTRGSEYRSTLRVLVNGRECLRTELPDDPADSRGCLSWHYQKQDNKLDEAGTYGYLFTAELPADLGERETLTITFVSDKGFSLFGRKSGRYPTAVEIL